MAAVSLEKMGYGIPSFFADNRLISPEDAVCPTVYAAPMFFSSFSFDTYTQQCVLTGGQQRLPGFSGGQKILSELREIFGDD